MKYKIHYKANDETNNDESIIKFMEKNGYQFKQAYQNILPFTKKEKGDQVFFNVNNEDRRISKYVLQFKNTNAEIEKDTLFTKEELRFFDLLDFETESIVVRTNQWWFSSDTKAPQDITDWIDM